MIAGRTILCFASGYDAPPTSKHHVMGLLSARNRVLWVNYHASRRPSASPADLAGMAGKLRRVFGGVAKARGDLYVLTPLVIPLPGAAWARRANRALLLGQIRSALSRLRSGPVQVWSFTPDIAYLLDGLEREKVVYYCVDDFASFAGYARRQVRRDEAELCRRADLVVTSSAALQRAKRALNPRTILVPHGVGYHHFARAVSEDLPVPEDLAAIPCPRLGFFGLIREWVDLELLKAAAAAMPDWHFVFLGDAAVDLSGCRGLANMHFLGRKPYAQLPAYCRQFDVGLIPFKVNRLTRAVNPIKLREYLAAGLPVVSTPMPEARRYERFVRIIRTPEALVAAVEGLLVEDPGQRRLRSESMAGETWPRKLERICQALNGGR